ncbi:C2 calcium-dependent membrane targeting [Macleaya cordata]|uniref:C2 calcium-dependent membrane targeting n=1 Tax=Macleaya cordata TaxID=56857 RepID=A0A200QCW5_MACCD|nr:C2 calcium-dependent membrane targeting [Macleaya cordata]
MKLLVRVVEARNLRAIDLNGSSDPYVRLKVGRQKFRTKVVKKSLNPFWGEDFCFRVEDLKEKLVISVMNEDKYFNDEFMGKLKFPILKVFDAENSLLETTWYNLQPRTKKSKNRDFGEILLTISLSQNNSLFDETPSCSPNNAPYVERYADFTSDSSSISVMSFVKSPSRESSARMEEVTSAKEEKSNAQTVAGRLAQIFQRSGETTSTISRGFSTSELPERPETEVDENNFENPSSDSTFDELMRIVESKDQGEETPSNLPGGVLVDQSYVVAPSDLNSLLFAPDSNFSKSMAELQGTTELQQRPWRFEDSGERLKRVVTYVNAATKLIKSVKATEEQTYLKVNGKVFVVLASVSIPDVPYGSTFKTEILYCITPGPELPSGEQSSRLVISWRLNFLQSTMMKGMIEGGARQGLKDSFNQFADLLSQNVKVVELKDLGSNKEQSLASLQVEPQSVGKLATQYFLNLTVFSTVFMGLYVLVHIFLAMPSAIQGLECNGIDLPDSIGEVIVSGILVLQLKRVFDIIVRFMHAKKQKGSDHGVKAQGDGWLLTVALIEGSFLAAVDSNGLSDPYVVFTCNSKKRTSSIKFQKSDPQWNEIFEFDAMDEPPSMLDVEVFDFDGPFTEATCLGHAEINFLKSNLSDLADIWIPLKGKSAQACQAKLHLRIFLNNTRGSNVVKEYLAKMEKEVGKKINVRSPQTNSAFQKLFGLPPEEFLINDFTCHLRRKMPLQGRLFLSARIIGFHTNMFGHVTKFFFLWEDVEDIQLLPPTLASMCSPSVIFVLRKGRGMDARHGAKTQDEEGRLKFHFQSFVSFNVANRTIVALWRAKSLSPEQKVRIVEEESGVKSLRTQESGSFLGLEDASMSEIYSSVLPVLMDFLMEVFDGGHLDRKVMEKVGCIDYSHSPWELVKPEIYQRQICYKFDKKIACYGGDVTSTQQKSTLSDRKGWVVEEIMTLNGVPLADYYTVHLRYQIEDLPSRSKSCNVQVHFGIAWLKSTRHQKRITKNIQASLTDHMKAKFSQIEKEFLLGN